jgi:hypothetical protein
VSDCSRSKKHVYWKERNTLYIDMREDIQKHRNPSRGCLHCGGHCGATLVIINIFRVPLHKASGCLVSWNRRELAQLILSIGVENRALALTHFRRFLRWYIVGSGALSSADLTVVGRNPNEDFSRGSLSNLESWLNAEDSSVVCRDCRWLHPTNV